MSTVPLIVSDLHMADGTSILDCFGPGQQAAFEGSLVSASSLDSPLNQSEQVELIINGDCFDFLVTTPYNSSDAPLLRKTGASTLVRMLGASHPNVFVTPYSGC